MHGISIMEEIFCRHLSLVGVATLTEISRQTIVDAVLKNEDLLFEWDMLAAEVEEDVSCCTTQDYRLIRSTLNYINRHTNHPLKKEGTSQMTL